MDDQMISEIAEVVGRHTKRSDHDKWFEGLEPDRKAYLRNMRAQEILVDAACQFDREGKWPRYLADLQDYLNYLRPPEQSNGE